MTRRRPTKPCRICGRSVKSVTGYCVDCRPADALPIVHHLGNALSFAGLTFTLDQARALADTIHDVLEGQTND
ncbi:MAG: hypothetical protein WBA98_13670 [Gordonia sp. (in: high G+C Gram-positive bacteria)]|uniref:hypothetical protein n=1 Tax=Gordonia sp. (in: high G+C Gram-positive bacteria) TaxID=84139 RepID=UPI003C74BAF8